MLWAFHAFVFEGRLKFEVERRLTVCFLVKLRQCWCRIRLLGPTVGQLLVPAEGGAWAMGGEAMKLASRVTEEGGKRRCERWWASACGGKGRRRAKGYGERKQPGKRPLPHFLFLFRPKPFLLSVSFFFQFFSLLPLSRPLYSFFCFLSFLKTLAAVALSLALFFFFSLLFSP